jgi:signal peptidase I
MPDETIKTAPDQEPNRGEPSTAIAPGPEPAARSSKSERPGGSEGGDTGNGETDVRIPEWLLFLRWVAGFLIILAAGWGFIALDIILARWLFPHTMIGQLEIGEVVGLVSPIPSFIFFFMLEKNLWLSRFMGLRLTGRSSRLTETLFFWLFGVARLLFVSMADPQPAGASARENEPNSTVRELLETVAFVVVLVLLLKTFVAEAFVIPTGSMATTLLGYNKEVTCPQCGVSFPVNCSDEVENRQSGQPLTRCQCWNCRYQIDFAAEGITPRTSSGDRVLVSKANNDTGLMSFKPGDVVVFKFPEGPQKNHVATNFIKRLIGLPEQTIGIYYGDVYVAEKEALLKALERRKQTLDEDELRRAMEQNELSLDPTESDLRLDIRRRIYKNRFKKLLEEGDPCFRIMRKAPAKIDAMKRPVYDNDHPARDLPKDKYPPRWAPELDGPDDDSGALAYNKKRLRARDDDNSWKADDANGFTCSGRDNTTAWLRYRHILLSRSFGGTPRDEDWTAQLINDFMSYNTGNSSNTGADGNRWVGDLLLECEVRVDKAEGELILELSRGVDRFQARWQLQSGQCALLRNGKEIATRQTRVSRPGTYLLRFANFDRRLTLWVNRELPFDDGVTYKPPQRLVDGKPRFLHGPSAKNDLEPASIGYRGGAVLGVHRIKLWRDTYYLSIGAGDESVSDAVFTDPSKWEHEYRLEAMTMYVQPRHYLCLGDNSPASSDSRIWKKENEGQFEGGGLVPERLMLGRALLVYWPLNRLGTIK